MSGGDPGTASRAGAAASLAAARLPMVRAIACGTTPSLAGLAHFVRVVFDDRFSVAAVGPSGLLFLNPALFSTADPTDLAFVFSHELMHLALDTHGRGDGYDRHVVNVSHDLVINQILLEDYPGFTEPPFGGIHWPGVAGMSLEQVIGLMLERDDLRGQAIPPRPSPGDWGARPRPSRTATPRRVPAASRGPLQEAFHRAGIPFPETLPDPATEPGPGELPPGMGWGDVLTPEEEELLGGGQQTPGLDLLRSEVRRLAAEANAAKAIQSGMVPGTGMGIGLGGESWQVEALRASSRPPWELAIQRWMDQAEPGRRTYARPSRKAGDGADMMLPGRWREGWALHVVLDTSGSMGSELAGVLGALACLCEASGVGSVRVVQCDACVAEDRWVEPWELSRFNLRGGGGSDMGPALEHLARDPGVRAVLVITDGRIMYPEEPPPFSVLWAVVGGPGRFQPGYGLVVGCG